MHPHNNANLNFPGKFFPGNFRESVSYCSTKKEASKVSDVNCRQQVNTRRIIPMLLRLNHLDVYATNLNAHSLEINRLPCVTRYTVFHIIFSTLSKHSSSCSQKHRYRCNQVAAQYLGSFPAWYTYLNSWSEHAPNNNANLIFPGKVFPGIFRDNVMLSMTSCLNGFLPICGLSPFIPREKVQNN